MKKIISFILVCVLMISSIGISAYAQEDESVITIHTSGGNTASYGASLDITSEPRFAKLDLTLYYNPEVLKYRSFSGEDVFPKAYLEMIKDGELHITYEWPEGIAKVTSIGSLGFTAIGTGEPQFSAEATVYDRNGNVMPSRIAFTDEAAEVVSDITWNYDEETDYLYIDGEGIIFNYFSSLGEGSGSDFRAPWYEVHDKAKHIVIGEGIISIGNYCFSGFDQLESIEISDSVKYIPHPMFFVGEDVVLRGKALGYVEEYNDRSRPYVFEPTNQVIRGDLDADGVLTAEDALMILKEVARLTSPRHRYTADHNEDGVLDADDALGVLKAAAKLL